MSQTVGTPAAPTKKPKTGPVKLYVDPSFFPEGEGFVWVPRHPQISDDGSCIEGYRDGKVFAGQTFFWLGGEGTKWPRQCVPATEQHEMLAPAQSRNVPKNTSKLMGSSGIAGMDIAPGSV